MDTVATVLVSDTTAFHIKLSALGNRFIGVPIVFPDEDERRKMLNVCSVVVLGEDVSFPLMHRDDGTIAFARENVSVLYTRNGHPADLDTIKLMADQTIVVKKPDFKSRCKTFLSFPFKKSCCGK